MEEEAGKRHITHYNYHSWPDFGNPQPTQFIDMVTKIHSPKDRPIVVHCSAGLGRSGVFITVHTALETQAAKRKVDIEKIVYNLRKQREGMVQTPDQYRFCYEATADALSAQQRTRTKSEPAAAFIPPTIRPLSTPTVIEPATLTREHRQKREASIPPPSPSLPPYTEEMQKEETAHPRIETPPPPESSPPPPISQQETPIKVAITPDVIVTAPSMENISDHELVQRKLDDLAEKRATETTPSRPASDRNSGVSLRKQETNAPKQTETKKEPLKHNKPAPKEQPKASPSKQTKKVSELPKKSESQKKKEPPPPEDDEVPPPPPPTSPPPTLEEAPPTPPTSPPPEDSEMESFKIPEAVEEPEEEEGGFSIGDNQFIEQKPYKKPAVENAQQKKPANKPEWSHKKKTQPQPQREWSYKTKKVAPPLASKIEKKPEIHPPPLEVVNRGPRESVVKRVGKLNIPSAFGGESASPEPSPSPSRAKETETLPLKKPPVKPPSEQPPKWKQDKKPMPSNRVPGTSAQSTQRMVGKINTSKFEQPKKDIPSEPEQEVAGSTSILQRIKQLEAKGSPGSHGATPFKLPTPTQAVKLSPTRQLPKNMPPVTVPLDDSDKVRGLLAKFEKKTNF